MDVGFVSVGCHPRLFTFYPFGVLQRYLANNLLNRSYQDRLGGIFIRHERVVETVIREDYADVGRMDYTKGCRFGTYPNAYFGEYDPATNKWTLWKQVARDTKYVTSFARSFHVQALTIAAMFV